MPPAPTNRAVRRETTTPHPYLHVSHSHAQNLPHETLAPISAFPSVALDPSFTPSSLASSSSATPSTTATATPPSSIPQTHPQQGVSGLSDYDKLKATRAKDILNHDAKSLMDPLADVLKSSALIGEHLRYKRQCCPESSSSAKRNKHIFSKRHLLSQQWSILQYTVIRKCPNCTRVSGLGSAMKQHIESVHKGAEKRAEVLLVGELENVRSPQELEPLFVANGMHDGSTLYTPEEPQNHQLSLVSSSHIPSGSHGTPRNDQSVGITSSTPSMSYIPSGSSRNHTPISGPSHRPPTYSGAPKPSPGISQMQRSLSSKPRFSSPLNPAARSSGADRSHKISRDYRMAQHPYAHTALHMSSAHMDDQTAEYHTQGAPSSIESASISGASPSLLTENDFDYPVSRSRSKNRPLFANPFSVPSKNLGKPISVMSSYTSLANALGPFTLQPGHEPARCLFDPPRSPPPGAYCGIKRTAKPELELTPHYDPEKFAALFYPEGMTLLNSCGSLDGALEPVQDVVEPSSPKPDPPAQPDSPAESEWNPCFPNPDDPLEELFDFESYFGLKTPGIVSFPVVSSI